MARIGPAEVRERYGVDPQAGAGFHRAARRPVRQAAGRARASARRAPPTSLRRYGSLEDVLAAGRFPTQADMLRLYRSIATMNAAAPLPPLADQVPTFAKAAALARAWELNRLADRLEGMERAEPVMNRVRWYFSRACDYGEAIAVLARAKEKFEWRVGRSARYRSADEVRCREDNSHDQH